MSDISVAALIAKLAHRGQKRRNGDDYFEAHVDRVATMVLQTDAPYDAVVVAYLHDVLEDTEVDYADLIAVGFSQKILDAVWAITRVKGEGTYAEFIERVASNPLATIVKIQDIRHNLGDAPTSMQVTRYEKALVRLGE